MGEQAVSDIPVWWWKWGAHRVSGNGVYATVEAAQYTMAGTIALIGSIGLIETQEWGR